MNKFLLLFLFVLLTIGCEEVIKVELDDADPQIVIEANISDNPKNNSVIITKSTDFYTPSEYEKISGAFVTITDLSNDSTFLFTEIIKGNYSNNYLSAQEGHQYKMTVSYNEIEYSAISQLNKKLIIDSLEIIGEKRPFKDELDYEYHLHFKDNFGIDDFARFRIYINDELKKGIFLYDDRLTDGNEIDYFRFFFDDNDKVKPNDKVKIEMFTIDKPVFEYFDTMRGAVSISGNRGGPSGSTAPSNPISNWSNSALGYFSVNSIDSISTIIQ